MKSKTYHLAYFLFLAVVPIFLGRYCLVFFASEGFLFLFLRFLFNFSYLSIIYLSLRKYFKIRLEKAKILIFHYPIIIIALYYAWYVKYNKSGLSEVNILLDAGNIFLRASIEELLFRVYAIVLTVKIFKLSLLKSFNFSLLLFSLLHFTGLFLGGNLTRIINSVLIAFVFGFFLQFIFFKTKSIFMSVLAHFLINLCFSPLTVKIQSRQPISGLTNMAVLEGIVTLGILIVLAFLGSSLLLRKEFSEKDFFFLSKNKEINPPPPANL